MTASRAITANPIKPGTDMTSKEGPKVSPHNANTMTMFITPIQTWDLRLGMPVFRYSDMRSDWY